MNEARLEKRLRFALECSTIVWKKPSRNTFASVTTKTGERFTITLPPEQDDDYTLRTLFHELCHVSLPGELSAFGVFEEDILIRVLEPRLMDHVTNRPRKHQWWMKRLREAKEGK